MENSGGILPLDLGKYKSIAVLGPNSDYGVAGDYGWAGFDHRECVTLFDGLRRAVGDSVRVSQCDGCDWWSQDGSGIPAAVELARKSDVSIVAVGTRSVWLGRGAKGKNVTSGEGFDLSSLDLRFQPTSRVCGSGLNQFFYLLHRKSCGFSVFFGLFVAVKVMLGI